MDSLSDSSEKITRLFPEILFNSHSSWFAQIVIAPQGKIIFISGQTSLDKDHHIIGKTMNDQMIMAFKNLRWSLDSADVKPEYVVKILVLIVNHKEEYIDILYREMVKLFGNNLPASTLIPVPRLARDNLLFEIEATAIIPT